MFKIISIEEWLKDIEKNIQTLPATELLYGPKLDRENLKEFCEYYMFDNIYEDHVFVKHHEEPDCYWWIEGYNTTLIYKPKHN